VHRARARARAAGAATPGPPGCGQRQQRDQGPAQPEQQPVGAGHVRRGVGDVGRVVPGGEGVEQVHRVLGQHGDQRQNGDRQPAGDVDLRGLRRPGQQETRRHHRGAVDHQLHHRIGGQPAGPQHDRGHRERQAQPERAQQRQRRSRCPSSGRQVGAGNRRSDGVVHEGGFQSGRAHGQSLGTAVVDCGPKVSPTHEPTAGAAAGNPTAHHACGGFSVSTTSLWTTPLRGISHHPAPQFDAFATVAAREVGHRAGSPS